MKNTLEVISLIFKSVDYLDLISQELLKDYTMQVPGWDIGIRIVANDASEDIKKVLETKGINYSIYEDDAPLDYYIRRVYRCYNYAVWTSEYDNICLVNSDMVFSNKWIENLLKHHDGINIPTSRLVESGKMPSGKHAISYNCGRTARTVDYHAWEKLTETISVDQSPVGGLYMPCVFEKQRFIDSGGYPDGNIGGQSGDAWFFNNLEKNFGMKHITVFDSLVYHIQEGEKDSKP